MTAEHRRVAGIAAVAYVMAAAIENMDILATPPPGSSAAAVRDAYADQAFGAVTGVAGVISLAAYVVAAAALALALRRDDEPWALVGLCGGIGGAVVAVTGLAATSALVATGAGIGDGAVEALYGVGQGARLVSGPFAALLLAGFGVAALRSRALPALLAVAALGLAVPLALAPIAAFTGAEAARIAAAVAFGGQSLWLLGVGLWLLFGHEATWPELVRRSAFLVLVSAAGLIGLGMLAAPGATGRFFAWELQPEALSAFAGGVYVGSAALYATALWRPWPAVRALVAGATVLSVTVLAWTLIHTEVFDFERLQAWAWVFLFGGFAVVTGGLLVVCPRGSEPAEAGPLRLALAAALGALAIALWIDPVPLSGPFELPPLGGRFAGSWIALLAALVAFAPPRVAGLALVLLPGGALLGGLRTVGDLDAPVAYLAVLAALAAAGVAIARAPRARSAPARAQPAV